MWVLTWRGRSSCSLVPAASQRAFTHSLHLPLSYTSLLLYLFSLFIFRTTPLSSSESYTGPCPAFPASTFKGHCPEAQSVCHGLVSTNPPAVLIMLESGSSSKRFDCWHEQL